MLAIKKVYSHLIRDMQREFCKKTALKCSLSTFFEYKPF